MGQRLCPVVYSSGAHCELYFWCWSCQILVESGYTFPSNSHRLHILHLHSLFCSCLVTAWRVGRPKSCLAHRENTCPSRPLTGQTLYTNTCENTHLYFYTCVDILWLLTVMTIISTACLILALNLAWPNFWSLNFLYEVGQVFQKYADIGRSFSSLYPSEDIIFSKKECVGRILKHSLGSYSVQTFILSVFLSCCCNLVQHLSQRPLEVCNHFTGDIRFSLICNIAHNHNKYKHKRTHTITEDYRDINMQAYTWPSPFKFQPQAVI